jgi:hypothetical protein
VPSLPISTPSYSRCATPIVRRTLKPSRPDASCCSLLVVYGAGAFRRRSFFSTDRTRHFARSKLRDRLIGRLLVRQRIRKKNLLAIRIRPIRHAQRLAIHANQLRRKRLPPAPASSSASTVQYSTGLNPLISLSRSTIKRSATVCTRPALNPRRTLSHSSGDT